MKIHKNIRRAFAAALAVLLFTLSAMPAFAASGDDTLEIDSYAPAGSENIASGASISISRCSGLKTGENTYEMPGENWCKSGLVDGSLTCGWSTDPYDRETDKTKPVTVTLDLGDLQTVMAVALFPNGAFPASYTVSLSADGETYTDVAQSTGNPRKPATPNVHSFQETSARYIRILITERQDAATADGVLAQLGEIAVYGKMNAQIVLNKNALELVVGEEDTLTATAKGFENPPTLSWKTSNSAVVTVDNAGHVKGISAGSATISAYNAEAGVEATAAIYVVTEEYSFDDNIMISIFWPPTSDYINDEQYKLMADAGITYVMGAGDALGSKADQLKMLELCYRYGIHMTVGDDRMGANLLGKTPQEVAALVNEYRNLPGASGYYILDEPLNPNEFITAYKALKDADPTAYMHLNFLPYGSYSSLETYKSQMNDWLRLCANTGYQQDYLMYDLYPFLDAGGFNGGAFIANMDACRLVGLANDVKTGTYIQTVRIPGVYRLPSDSELRFEVNMALAYGYKQLSYFTWFTPVERSEPFETAIISSTGEPNAHYQTIKQLDNETLAIGKTLIRCDAKEVYANHSSWGQQAIPSNFFLQPKNSSVYTVSYLRDKQTGRNYFYLVNNNFSNAQSVSIELDSSIGALWEVSKIDGSLVPVDLDGQTMTIELSAGDGALFALPESYDYESGNTDREPDAGTNLALDAQVTCDSSVGTGGWYMDNLNDGKCFSVAGDMGWKSTKSDNPTITLDLGALRSFNRLDLYPAGDAFDYGTNLPRALVVAVSDDGETWRNIYSTDNFGLVDGKAPSILFDAVRARYLQIAFTAWEDDAPGLAEIELYNDDGSVGATKEQAGLEITDDIVAYTPGMNLALQKKVYYSTTTPDSGYRDWGWHYSFINDGSATKGWTSNVKIHDVANATEYITIDLGDIFSVNRIVVTPMGCWPVAFEIQVSTDGKTWKTVAAEKSDKARTEDYIVEMEEAVTGRFVRFLGTKLRGSATDGFMLQLGEIAVYGLAYCDRDYMNAGLKTYLAAGGSESAAEYIAVKNAMENENMTNNEAKKLVAALLALVDKTEPDEEETDPPEHESDPIDTPPKTEPVSAQTVPLFGTEPQQQGGCGSLLPASVVGVGVAFAAVCIFRKKEEDEKNS